MTKKQKGGVSMKKLLFTLLLITVAATFWVRYSSLFAAESAAHGGDIVYNKPVKAVLFSHQVHVEDKGLSCEMCHAGMFETMALKAQENKDFTMGALYQGKFCGACHNGQMAFASNVRCASCHIGVKGYKRIQEKEAQKRAAP